MAMNVLSQIRDSGWGAVFLFLYLFVITYRLMPELSNLLTAAVAAVPTVAVIYLSIVFNDGLMEVLAGDTMQQTFGEIKDHMGDDEFYWDAEGGVQEQIDEMDQKAHQQAVTIVTGGIIGLTLPFVVWYEYGMVWGLAGVIGSVAVFYLLSYRPYRQLQEIIKSSVKPYKAEYEN